MTVCTCVSPENMMTGANTPTTLKIAPAMSARVTTRSLNRPKNAAETFMNPAVRMASARPRSASGTMRTASITRKLCTGGRCRKLANPASWSRRKTP